MTTTPKYIQYFNDNHLKHKCLHCGELISLLGIKKRTLMQYSSEGRGVKFCNKHCSGKYKFRAGKDHPAYKNGSGLGYVTHKSTEFLDRLGRKCIKCGSTENIIVHYKDGDRGNQVIENAEPICRSCRALLMWEGNKKYNTKEDKLKHDYRVEKNKRDLRRRDIFLYHFGKTEYLFTNDVAEGLGISRERVRQLRNMNKLKYVKDKGKYLYLNWYKGKKII